MGERPDQVGRDPLADNTAFDPATDAFEPGVLDRDAGLRAGAEVDEIEVDRVEVTRVEIERTRADMSETVDAIQDRLNPENLKEQAKDKVREATVGTAQDVREATVSKAQDAGSGITDAIKNNPLPAALTGIGLGWLIVSARKQNSSNSTNEYAPVARDYDDHGHRRVYVDDESEGSSTSSAGEALGRARDGVGQTASQAQDKVGQVAGQTKDKANDLAGRAKDRASRLGSQAQSTARRAGSGSQRMLRENPLAVGALAAGVGAAVGLAIPETSKENEVMGETRDNLVEKAQEKAQDAQQRVQRVAEEAQGAAKDAAKQEAENQGLSEQ